jgi:hypothetical protein
MIRHADLSGDEDADRATYEAMKSQAGLIEKSEVPEPVFAVIDRDFGPRAFAEGGAELITAPFVDLPD